MATEKYIPCQRKERKRRRSENPFLSLRSNLFILLIFCCLLVTISSSVIEIVIRDTGSQQIINGEFASFISQVKVNDVEQSSCKTTCTLTDANSRITLQFDAQLASCENMFNGLSNIIKADLTNFDASQVTSMSNMFNGCTSLKEIIFGNINTESLQNMNSLFKGCQSLLSVDLSHFTTSGVTVMENLFYGCSALKSINFGTNFDTSKVNSFYRFFSNCESLASIDISSFDVRNIINMEWMFNGCKALVSLNLGTINPSKLENMNVAFQNCELLESIDLSHWDLSSIQRMTATFKYCYNLKSIQFGNVETHNLVDMIDTFRECKALISVDLSKFDFSKVTSMVYMFAEGKALTNVNFGTMNTQSLKDITGLFIGCDQLKSFDFSNWDLSQVTSMEQLFFYCTGIEEITFGNAVTSSLKNMKETFRDCKSLKSIDLSNLDLSKVETMYCMFFECFALTDVNFGESSVSSLENVYQLFLSCTSLRSVDLSIFRTSKVTDLAYLFCGCGNLESADISFFDMSQITNMDCLFFGCQNLKSVNFGSVGATSLENLKATFKECSKLTTLDLSGWDTSKVTTMEEMFADCTGFKYLNLSHFDTSSVGSAKNMFSGYDSLRYLNLYLFDLAAPDNIEGIFNGLKYNTIYCIKDDATKNYIVPSEKHKFCFCDIDCYIINFTKTDYMDEKCLDSCTKCPTSTHNYEYETLCYDKCPSNTLNYNNLCLDLDCDVLADYSIECDDNSKPLGYYLDPDDQVYKKCYESCKTCEEEGDKADNKCTECKSDYQTLNDYENDNNCYKKCEPNYYYFDSEKKHHCTDDKVCPDNYNYLIVPKGRCIDKCENDNTYKYSYYGTCIDQNIPETTQNIISTTQSLIQETTYIENSNTVNTVLTEEKNNDSSLYHCLNDSTLINECFINDANNITETLDLIRSNILSNYEPQSLKSSVFQGAGQYKIQITTQQNELSLLSLGNLSYYGLSVIDLGECETLLKKEYNISEGDALIILKKEKETNKASEKDIEYELYEPYNKTLLNLSICSDVNINIYMKVDLSDDIKTISEDLEKKGYNIFDINDPFYTDICTPYKSSSKSDMLLSDRINDIYNNDDAQCQDNCYFSNYIDGSNVINCTCHIQQEEKLEIKKIDKLNPKTLSQSFYYVLKYSNYKIFKCYKLVFDKSVFTKNKGGIILFILFFLYLMCLIVHIIKGLTSLKEKLGESIEEQKRLSTYKNTENFPPKKIRSSMKHGGGNKGSLVTLEENAKSEKVKFEKEPKKIKRSKTKAFKEKKDKKNIKKSSSSKEILKPDKSRKSSKFKIKIQDRKESEGELNDYEKEKKNMDDFQLNDLKYEEALKYDQRNFFRTYYSIIKREHRIIFTFFVCNDYNLAPVKLSKFIFLLATDMTMNVFFFSDSSMHKIYLNYGKYDFVQQIPQIIYSTIVSQILEVFLCYLSITDSLIYEIKDLPYDSKTRQKIRDTFTCIKRKLVIYFIFTFLFFLVYWYIVAVFCAVYENTQITFIKDSLFSSLFGFIYPFVLYLFPSVFRKLALNCKNNTCLYKFSGILPFF